MNQVIAFVGLKSAGKNTAAIPLIDRFDFVSLSFADAMKDSLASIFCWDRALLEGITDESRLWREEVDVWWSDRLGIADFTPRWAMTRFGTEVMRRHFDETIWVLNMERRIMLLGDVPIVLVDARFPNEIALARRKGGRVARIQRGADPAWMTGLRDGEAPVGVHESEYAWVNCPVDVTLSNDRTITALQESVIAWYLADQQMDK